MAEQRFELEQLMEEKRKLLALQENLQRLHDELPRITQNDVSAATTRQAAASVRQQEHAQVQTENDPSVLNTEVKSISETTQVTFGEPLETVISNEELYGRMRQQRILREELREKKKELENFMKKDRPKRHYFRNQDNQSDNISYSNKSDQYGASASEDVTMATWGGSTAGNMESIEENDSREGQGVEDCNDGYPNDGIIQVEEEEEANDQSEDRVTYTVEDDFSNKRMHGLPAVGSPCGHNGNRKGGKGAPFVSTGAAANYSYSQWAANQHTVLNNARRPAFEQSKLGRARRMPPRKDKAVEDEINSLKEQVQYLTSLIQNKPELASSQLFPSQLGPSMTSPGLFSPFPSSYPNQAYDRQLLSAMEEMRERISMLERNSIYLEPWHQRSWPHHPGCIPSGSMPLAGHSVPVVQNYDTPPMSNESIALDQAPSVRPCPPNVGFVDLYAPSVPSSSYAYRNWANTRQREPTSVDRPAGYSEKHDEAGEGIRSCHTVSVESQHTSSYSMAAQEMPTSLVHSADNIPIETVHAVNEQAIRERGRTRMRSSRSDETMAASTFLTNKEKKAYDKQFTCDRAKDDIVIACRFSTPMRLATGAHLAEQQLSEDLLVDPGQRPSNEAVMSAQTVSSVAGSDGDVEQYRAYVHASTKTPDDAESDASNDIRAFEALRETIYAEVATLISQNETRPHFLIKLFRELQHLDSDYLRQRVLYAIQDLVLKRLTEDNIACNQVSGNRHNNLAPAPEDLTPSESLLSTEDGNKDDNGDINSRGAESVNSDRFDYAENVDTSSSLSTPTSTDTHSDQPFAGDSLGDTVIHMEKHPGIDTHQLDVQIKDIMKEIMPVLKEHMDEICSQHLLQYIKRLVMLLMKQHDEEHEMARFFHGQLGTLLQDALAKFEGRRLRDCGEDLLVDMSEILFNELAFFRLMQGLDNPKAKVKASLQQWQQNEPTILIDNTASAREESKELKTSRTNHQHETFCSPGQEEDDIHSSSSSESPAQNGQIEDEDGQQLASMKGSSEGYILPFGLKQDQDSGETSYFSAMKIELAPSETKPYTRIGSDEDDEGDDEAANNEEPSDTAVSRDAQNGIMDDSSSADEQLKNDKLIQDSTNGDSTVLKQEQPKEEKSEEAPTTTNNPESSEQEKEKDDDDTEKEAASGTDGKINNSELTIDDLPTKLTGLSEEELAGKMAAEQEANQITEAMASAVPPGGTPLAGDPEAVNGPA
ncbi:hypothetical protein LSH36_246g02074 [Paralvinella palmiformis]|uniref:Pericentriolar material 1 protein C-terminal domain-containing protein n=1 Tax=Paralvinella palmiformis TaxID=53620 RepID=A0AAD9N4Z2_9ANNE|nr:hypothetical protein LSH36_246g02074 [Paralvinella palmiformis]